MIQILIGIGMICVTAYIHAFVLALAIKMVKPIRKLALSEPTTVNIATALAASVFWVMLAHLIETTLWSLLFLKLDIFEDIETSFYFSLVSYTTLGLGDITLPESWRILSGFVASNGFLVFGWSTAFQVTFLSSLKPDYINEEKLK